MLNHLSQFALIGALGTALATLLVAVRFSGHDKVRRSTIFWFLAATLSLLVVGIVTR